MAHTRACGVFRVTTTEDIPSVRKVKNIIVIPSGGNPDVTIKDKDTNGNIVWEAAPSASTRISEDVCINSAEGLRVEITNAIVFLYE